MPQTTQEAPSVSRALPTSSSTLELTITNMSCAACARHVEKTVRTVPGVDEVTVDPVTHHATVRSRARLDIEALTAAIERAGYGVASASAGRLDRGLHAEKLAISEDQELRLLFQDFTVAVAFSLPLLVLAMSHGAIPFADTPSGRLAQFFLATPVVFGPGRRFLRLAWVALKQRRSNMNTLVSLGVLSAWLYSTIALLLPELSPHATHGALPHLYFEAAAAILCFVLLGKLLETRARKLSSEAVRKLAGFIPKTARRILLDGTEEDVSIDRLVVGDQVLVRPGERVPTDGRVLSGIAAIDESMMTGESLPIEKQKGALVFGGALNQNGSVTLQVTHTGPDTVLAQIVEAVEQARRSRAPIARLADTVSGYFVPIVLGFAALTWLVWAAIDPSADGLKIAFERFVAVLLIACPCALGLATPAAVVVGTGRGAELGILVKGGAALEAASRVDTVLLDKTGTVTEGRPTLTDLLDVSGRGERALLGEIAAVARNSEHPVSQAIVAGAVSRGASRHEVTHFVTRPGAGVQGVVEGRCVRLGTSAWLAEGGISTQELDERAKELAALGRTPSFVASDGVLAGLVAVADRPKREAKRAIEELKLSGIHVALVSGDRSAAAHAVASELGIEQVFSETRPEEKARIVSAERERGRVVAMVGDGINDAPALATANVGIAIATGTDVAIAAADMTLLRIGALPQALRLARATLRTIRQNLFWAFLFNVIGIPVAAGALYPVTGWLLSPILASAAMALSSVSVLTNSLRLRRFGRTFEAHPCTTMSRLPSQDRAAA